MRNFFILGLLFFFCGSVVFAASDLRCLPGPIKTQNKNIVLPGSDENHPVVYFLHNISKQSIWVDHPSDKKGTAHAGWSSYIQPDKWSALLLNRKGFAISCGVIEPGKVIYQNCASVLSVCTTPLTVNAKRKGSYWLVENEIWDNVMPALEKRGVISNQPTPSHNHTHDKSD